MKNEHTPSRDKVYFVTGVAGFIGFHTAKMLLSYGCTVHGLDNLNEYYDVGLKQDRLKQLMPYNKFKFHYGDLQDMDLLTEIFESSNISCVIHLAAQAGVRYSIDHPDEYIKSNIVGFQNILEVCRKYPVEHLIYASSSSVYGMNTKMPYSVHHNVDHPISLYAATKKANELMAHTYSYLYKIPTTGLRFFTVYGPWGRPDMALFIFTKTILQNEPIEVYNNGHMMRDFTYIDDIVASISRLVDKPPKGNSNWDRENPDPATSSAPYRIYNIGNESPVMLMQFIKILEEKLGKKAKKIFLPLQDGDVKETFADVEDLVKVTGYRPKTSVEDGISRFVDWYLEYYNDKNLQ